MPGTPPSDSDPSSVGRERKGPIADLSRTSGSAPASTRVEQHPDDTPAEVYEQTHVHAVYEAIAPHFSATRHKPWPLIADFLRALPPGALGLDVGCGNGKYLAVNPDVFLVGSDRSAALASIARDQRITADHASADVLVADGLALPFRTAAFDFVICVAVLHHLSTRERRVEGLRKLLACVDVEEEATDEAGGGDGGRRRPAGRVLAYVWALEQGSSRRGWDEGGDQDLLVPWVMKGGTKARPAEKAADAGDPGEGGVRQDRTYQRYYHLYRKGELEEDVVAAGGRVENCGYEKDNWWVIATRRNPG